NSTTGAVSVPADAGPYRRSASGLLKDRTELHGEAHIARDAELALHEGAGAVELTLHHFLEGLQTDRDRAPSALSRAVRGRIGRRFSVDQNAAHFAEVEF